MSDHVKLTFAELIKRGILDIGDGYRAKVDELGGDGPIFLRAGHLTASGWNWRGVERFRSDPPSALAPKMGRPGDTVITTKGNSIGRTGYVPPDTPEFVYSPHLSYWRSRDSNKLDANYLQYWARGPEFSAQLRALAHGTDMAPYLSLADQKRLQITLPEITRQKSVGDVLRALDDKIAVNERIATTARRLGIALFVAAKVAGKKTVPLESITSYLNRGQAPRYTDDESGVVVINQKCVRDGRVHLGRARRTIASHVHQERKLMHGDVLVNSTGVGTLGRVGIWSHAIAATADSHLTIARINPAIVPPILGGFSILATQQAIEGMGEGSTGQTELSRAKLGRIQIDLPTVALDSLVQQLSVLETRADTALKECAPLSALRDALLPELMSGKIRVRDTERIVEDAL